MPYTVERNEHSLGKLAFPLLLMALAFLGAALI